AGAEHPERRPDPLTERQSDACLDPAILCREQSLCLQARRGEARFSSLDSDDQVAKSVEMYVLRKVGIGLEFLIAPASVVTQVEGPFGGIRKRVGGAVEFVEP